MKPPITKPWVVIPTYNEKDNIARMIDELFKQSIPNLTILIVDDNSPDGTADIVRSKQAQYPQLQLVVREKKAGLGQAYIHGFTYAIEHGADAIAQMDADFSHDPADVPKLFQALDSNDLAVGSRYSQGISVINWPLSRLIISMGGSLYARLITGIPLHDATSGFKAWRVETLKAVDLPTINADGYGFQIAMNYRAWKKKYQIKEVPIVFTERREGASKMSKAIVREALWLVWRLRLTGK